MTQKALTSDAAVAETPSLYADLVAAGIEIGNHESDLYFPSTPESLAILDRHPLQKGNATRFRNQAPPNVGQLWIDVPFAYLPFWEKAGAWQRAMKGGAL